MSARLRIAVGAGLAVAVALAVAATLGLGGAGADQPSPRRTGPAATTAVTRQTLVESVTVSGEIGYGEPVPLALTAPGTVTWLPAVGTTVRRGEPLLRADERPVVLLYGAVPMYRALGAGAKGADVRQLEANLVALGYGGFTVDDSFSAATTGAVKRWQERLGLDRTGTVEAHRVVFASGPVRVARWLARLGGSATGDVLATTGRTRVVTVTASAAETTWATVGASVTVALPGGDEAAGRVSQASTAAPAGGSDQAGDVKITVALPDQTSLDRLERTVRLDGSPVRVTYVVSRHADVLTVPVTALLALAEGGYGLEVVTGGGTRVVAVEVGLFADGRVEVSGSGIAEGTTVGMPGDA
jgi:peptidoglycan hydrolase-like protein with peptidoglycan-binding domain